MKTIRVRVAGKVQHVGFRACTRKIATTLGIGGTVRNLRNGTVEIDVTGDDAVLEKFVAMIYNCPRAAIWELEIENLPLSRYPEFSICREIGQ
ncbi:MAG: acylphosphatase [Methanofollis sp.]|nr:acylphosphatase [Methanofollis sp.]